MLLGPLILSLGLIAGSRWRGVVVFGEYLNRCVQPIQYTADMPVYLAEQGRLFFHNKIHLIAENLMLQQQQIYLQAQIQKLLALESENKALSELLRSVGQQSQQGDPQGEHPAQSLPKESFFEARLVGADSDPFSHQILLNKGTEEGVAVGLPVIDAHGIVGLVHSASAHLSRVLLLTDAGFAVPVQSVRSGERAIAMGSGAGGELRLQYVLRTADFMEGDQLVTSGIGGRFPAGYPVGTITSIQHDPSTYFILIGVMPSAKLGQLRHVLFVKQEKA